MKQRVVDVARFIGRNAKRTAVAVIGAAFVVAGFALLVLPGPGLLVIIVGLAILATEFAWAEHRLDQAKDKAKQAGGAVRRGLRRRG